MSYERHRTGVISRGLSEAAVALAARGRKSALELSRQATAFNQQPEVLAAHCRVALSLYDIDLLEEALDQAKAFALPDGGLASLVAQIQTGPMQAVALARRLPKMSDLGLSPVPGRTLYVLHKSRPYQSDGYAMRSHGLLKGLQAAGADVVCITRPGFPRDLQACGAREGKALDFDTVDGVKYHRLPVPLRSAYPPHPWEYMAHASFAYLERATEVLVEAIRRHRPSLVVAASNNTTALPACLAAHGMGLPFVYEVRGFWELSRAAEDPGYILTTTGRQERFLETALARAAQAVITLTGPMRDELIERGVETERIHLVPNACDPDLFVPALRDSEFVSRLNFKARRPVIGYVGSLNPYEGLDDLILACAWLRRKGLDFRLLLVGSEPPDINGDRPVTRKLQRLAAEEGLNDWLVMVGSVPPDEVPRWYSLIDIAPFPRKSVAVSELVSPLKPLEAMAMGKAVIVTSVGGMREMVLNGENGLIVTKDDPTSLAQALRCLLQDDALRIRLGANARRWVKNERTWPHSARSMLNVLSGLS